MMSPAQECTLAQAKSAGLVLYLTADFVILTHSLPLSGPVSPPSDGRVHPFQPRMEKATQLQGSDIQSGKGAGTVLERA